MTARPPLEAPEWQVEGDGLRFVWPSRQLMAYVERVREDHGDVLCEVTFSALRDGRAAHILGPARLNLLSDSAATRVANNLAKLAAEPGAVAEWQRDLHVLLHQVQTITIRWYRTPPAVVDLATVEVPAGPLEYLVPILLPTCTPTLIVANGGGGKSFLALTIAAAVRAGLPLPGLGAPTATGRVLYLDWETTAQEHARRLRRLARGWGVPPPAVEYLRLDQTIDQLTWLRAEIARRSPVLVVVDSVGYAVGGDLKEAGTATALFRAVNSWQTSTLLLHHENRDGGFYGTIYLRNSARCMWLLESLSDPGDLRLSLVQDKLNGGALYSRPLGLRLHFDDARGAATWHSLDALADPGLASRQPLLVRLRRALQVAGEAVALADLATELGVTERTLRDLAREHPGTLVLLEGGGRGHKTRLGLRHPAAGPA